METRTIWACSRDHRGDTNNNSQTQKSRKSRKIKLEIYLRNKFWKKERNICWRKINNFKRENWSKRCSTCVCMHLSIRMMRIKCRYIRTYVRVSLWEFAASFSEKRDELWEFAWCGAGHPAEMSPATPALSFCTSSIYLAFCFVILVLGWFFLYDFLIFRLLSPWRNHGIYFPLVCLPWLLSFDFWALWI